MKVVEDAAENENGASGGGTELESGAGVDCPVCGEVFDSQQAMEGHVSGSAGEHKGMVGTDARQLQAAEPEQEDTSDEGLPEFPENFEKIDENGETIERDDELDEDHDEDLGEALGVIEEDEGDEEEESGSQLNGIIPVSILAAAAWFIWFRGLDLNSDPDAREVMVL